MARWIALSDLPMTAASFDTDRYGWSLRSRRLSARVFSSVSLAFPWRSPGVFPGNMNVMITAPSRNDTVGG